MAAAVESTIVNPAAPEHHIAPAERPAVITHHEDVISDKMDESASAVDLNTNYSTDKNTSSTSKQDEENDADDGRRTPTRDSFLGVPGQRPLPDQPLTSSGGGGLAAVVRSHLKDIDDDIDMGDADADTVADEEASDNESATSESQKPAKKKKGQRFFCTDFPPCQLSFTRSEHLARHIRKHTGERPFQCHCSRRFSRLDNLRQHAQTVHVNEDIPGDSLAATSTRFQRQVRTDRVRPTPSRPRTSTVGSVTSPTSQPARGHNRNLSTSSIASTTSSFSVNDEYRKRQQPLAMALDSNKRPAGVLDEYVHAPYDTSPHYHQQGSGMNTPTSQLYTFGNSSFASGYASPTSARSSYHGGPRHIRRLSVPSSTNPYQSNPYASSGQLTPTSVHGSVYSNAPSGYASPTSSVFSQGRLENESEIEYRRRTWHPNTQSNYTQRPATSGLSYHQTPDEERPAMSSQPAASQFTRLPGIESFDQVPPLPIRQPSSPLMSDAASRPYTIDRSLDHALHQGLNRLDITANGPQNHDSYWPRPELASLDRVPPIPPIPPMPIRTTPYMHHMSMPEQATTPKRAKRQAWYGGPVSSAESSLQPSLPLHTRTSPEDSGSSDGIATPAMAQSQEQHPIIVNHNDSHMAVDERPSAFPPSDKPAQPPNSQSKPAMPTRADSGFPSYQSGVAQNAPPMPVLPTDPYNFRIQSGHDPATAIMSPHQPMKQHANDMGRLEALVAVATSENRATEARH